METNLRKALAKCSKPERVCMVVVSDPVQKRANITPVGWKMWASARPRMMAFSISPERYSHDLLMTQKECVLAWPGADIMRGVLVCGSTSGRTSDKFSLTGWTPARALNVSSPLIRECIVNLECTLEKTMDAGDHTLFLVAVIEGHITENGKNVLFTVNDELSFSNLGGSHGYKFGVFL